MKRYLKFFIALLMSAGMLASQGLSAQKRVVKVQGHHPHELLTRKAAEGTWQPKALSQTIGQIDPSTVNCWTGHLDPTLTNFSVDTAYLLVKWTDGKREEIGITDSMLLWGYVWNSYSIYNDPTYGPDTTWITKTTVDMLRAVANADCRFSVLLQYTGIYGYTVGGIGYNYSDDSRVPLEFDLDGAQQDALIKYRYAAPFNCDMGQAALPVSPQQQIDLAIDAAVGEPGLRGTGIIEHPLNYNYGYPAYDYDHWLIDPSLDDNDHVWQAGWYHNGYWAFYTGENRQVPANYSSVGVSSRVLKGNSVDGFVFDINFSSHDMSGEITPATACGIFCNPCYPVFPAAGK